MWKLVGFRGHGCVKFIIYRSKVVQPELYLPKPLISLSLSFSLLNLIKFIQKMKNDRRM